VAPAGTGWPTMRLRAPHAASAGIHGANAPANARRRRRTLTLRASGAGMVVVGR
jgi:hypothetical protein